MRTSRTALFIGIIVVSFTLRGAVDAQGARPSELDRCLRGRFHGITETSVLGEVIGKPDKKDWGCIDASGQVRLESGSSAAPVPPGPFGLCLNAAYPNPTEQLVRIPFSLGESKRIILTVYGQPVGRGPTRATMVRRLFDAPLAPGVHEILWDSMDDAGNEVPAGIYRVVVEDGEHALCGDIEVR